MTYNDQPNRLCVNQHGTNHNRYTWRFISVHKNTDDSSPQTICIDLLPFRTLPRSGHLPLKFAPAEHHSPWAAFAV